MASTLQAYAKKRKKEETTVITARIPNSNYLLFKKYCDEFGLSINEAINILINNELQSIAGLNNESIQEEQENINQITIDDVIKGESEVSATLNTKVNTNKNTKSNSSRFTYDSFEIDKQIPCPICNEWYDKTNFARHTKTQHNITPRDLLLNDEYKVKINEMVESRKLS